MPLAGAVKKFVESGVKRVTDVAAKRAPSAASGGVAKADSTARVAEITPKQRAEATRKEVQEKIRSRAKQEKLDESMLRDTRNQKFRQAAAERGQTPAQYRGYIRRQNAEAARQSANAAKLKVAQENAARPEVLAEKEHQQQLLEARQRGQANKLAAKRKEELAVASGEKQPEWKKKALIYGGGTVAATTFVAGAGAGAAKGAVQGAMAPPEDIYRKRTDASSPYTMGDIWPNPDDSCARKERKAFTSPKRFDGRYNNDSGELELEEEEY